MLDVNVAIVLLSIILSRFAFDICSWNSSSVVWLICVTFCCWNHVTPAAQARGATSEALAVWTNAALWWNYDGNVYWRQRVNEQQCRHVVIYRNSGPSITNKFVPAENPNIKKREMNGFGFRLLNGNNFCWIDCLILHVKKKKLFWLQLNKLLSTLSCVVSNWGSPNVCSEV